MLLACPVCDSRFRVSPQMLGDGRDVRCSKCGNQWFAMPVDMLDDNGNAAVAPRSASPAPAGAAEMLPSMTQDDDSFDMRDESMETVPKSFSTAFERELADEPLPEESVAVEETDIDLDALDAAIAAQSGPARYVPIHVATRFRSGPWMAVAAVLILANLVTALMTMRGMVIEKFPVAAGLYEMIGYGNTRGLALGDLTVTSSGKGPDRAFDVSGVVYNGTKRPKLFPPLEIDLVDGDGNVLRGWPVQTGETIAPGKTSPFRNLPQNKLTSALVEQATELRFRLGSPLELGLHE